ncbi:hypothetical protein [Rhizobium leguminosarum]|uniref:hypothetical protein n=1 Tax=Rhizobium leguminosarum TaxID=384 RepID=UPI0013EEBE00|nr:hypothetical protein [Rhizobium leguminosarum]
METMRRTLLIEPYGYVRERFEPDARIAIYAGKTVKWRLAEHEQVFDIVHPVDETFSHLADVDFQDVKARISANIPLFYRWMGESDTYEDNQRSFLIFVLRLTEVLRRLEVAHAIFFTGVAHHVEYTLIEIACRLANVKQVFLYPMPFGAGGRLLPVVQTNSIKDREFLGLELSGVDFRDDVIAYRDNYLARGVPKQNERIGGPAVSRSYAYFKLAEREARQRAKTIVRKQPAVPHLIDRRRGYGLSAMSRVINRQKYALDYYSSKAISNEEAERLIARENPLPLLYAHYQPEASTFPEGGSFSDHLDVVLAIRRAGYSGKILYKEHPGSWIYYSKITGFSLVGIARSVEYYHQLEALGCVFLQPRFRPGNAMMRQVLPVTITGSIAVERSLTGWRTCCAGVPWFKHAPGVTGIDDCFGPDGIFYDPEKWRTGEHEGIDWFAEHLSRKTVTNYPGIGTGVASTSESDKQEFLGELRLMIDALASSVQPNETDALPQAGAV